MNQIPRVGFDEWFQPDALRRSIVFWAIWHAAVAAGLAGLVWLTASEPATFSSLGPGALALGAGYFALSLYVVPAVRRSPFALAFNLVVGTIVVFGAAYALLRMGDVPVSPKLVGVGGMGAMAASLVPYLSWRARIPVLSGFFLAALVIVVVLRPKANAQDPAMRVVATALHSLSVKVHFGLIDPPAADGGAIEGLGPHLLLATGVGKFYWIASSSGSGTLSASTLQIPAPADRAAYLADFEAPARAPRLRLTDIAFERSPTPQTLFAAHQSWNSARRCYTMRVSAVTLTWGTDGTPAAASAWRKVFDSQPCVAATGVFDDSESGGRLAWAPDGGLLLTLGDFGHAGLDGNERFSQSDDVDYGKILRIDPALGVASVFSKGHRNSQGLVVDRLGRIWNSEHGPQGGDEVNLVLPGGNYGWPDVTYGTSYGTRNWPLNPDGRDHGAFREPAVAFVPAVATTALIELRGEEFARWDGDLLLGSLREQSLFRIRLRGDRVVYVEPIRIGQRIRDVAQTSDGRLFIWSDAGSIVEVRRSMKDDAFNRLCAGCHAPVFGAAAGPSLAGVVGRDIASLPTFRYSAALSKLDGTWTEAALDSFLRGPRAYAPGTTMGIGGLDDATRAEVIGHLKATRR
jgi:cytochrome c2